MKSKVNFLMAALFMMAISPMVSAEPPQTEGIKIWKNEVPVGASFAVTGH